MFGICVYGASIIRTSPCVSCSLRDSNGIINLAAGTSVRAAAIENESTPGHQSDFLIRQRRSIKEQGLKVNMRKHLSRE